MADPLSSSRHASAAMPLPVEYQFSTDPALLHQYYHLRTRMFISVWGLKDFDAAEDFYDPISDILIARQGKLCVGGARLTFSYPGKRVVMPMEAAGFQLSELLPELDLEHRSYGECSRMAVLPEFRTKEMAFQLRYQLIKQCLRRNADYAFWIAPLPQARNYRQTCVNLGLGCSIRTDVTVPDREEYEGIKMYLVLLDFTGAKRRAEEEGISAGALELTMG